MPRDGVSVTDLEREAIAAAQIRPPAKKLRDGLELFDRTCQIMAAGIRHERPDASPAEVLDTVRERLRLARALETR
jgi:hypothetical protein